MSKRKESKKPSPGVAAPRASTTASGLDLAAVRELARIAGEFGLSEIEAEPSGYIRISRATTNGETSFAVSSAMPSQSGPTIALAPPPPLEGAKDPGMVISSPFVGTFYRSPSPEASVFVEVGQSVRKGQVVCIVEAMKLMNEIEAEADGKVVEILVKNGEHVEYGQTLIRLTPA
jgi:acetyl-CoA carboxylase biotin carboxyl carrier protein